LGGLYYADDVSTFFSLLSAYVSSIWLQLAYKRIHVERV
jgi:hypothetical protein